MHRLVNALCHAAAGELVGQLATQLFVLNTNPFISEGENAMWLQLITKIVFCLHPTHVEVTANAANRNHILAVLLALIVCFITTPFWLFLAALVSGYLASETFVFLIPGIMVTMTVLAFTTTNRNSNNKTDNDTNIIILYLRAILSIAPRLLLLDLRFSRGLSLYFSLFSLLLRVFLAPRHQSRVVTAARVNPQHVLRDL